MIARIYCNKNYVSMVSLKIPYCIHLIPFPSQALTTHCGPIFQFEV